MPPNLGGFFMVRSYYPSECHADYFDFERIEALKPAIEACGISTLSQSPMLGFNSQLKNATNSWKGFLPFLCRAFNSIMVICNFTGHRVPLTFRNNFVFVTRNLLKKLAKANNVLPNL